MEYNERLSTVEWFRLELPSVLYAYGLFERVGMDIRQCSHLMSLLQREMHWIWNGHADCAPQCGFTILEGMRWLEPRFLGMFPAFATLG